MFRSYTECWVRNTTTGQVFRPVEEWRIFGLDPKMTEPSYQVFLDTQPRALVSQN
jgi:hypothetical protein